MCNSSDCVTTLSLCKLNFFLLYRQNTRHPHARSQLRVSERQMRPNAISAVSHSSLLVSFFHSLLSWFSQSEFATRRTHTHTSCLQGAASENHQRPPLFSSTILVSSSLQLSWADFQFNHLSCEYLLRINNMSSDLFLWIIVSQWPTLSAFLFRVCVCVLSKRLQSPSLSLVSFSLCFSLSRGILLAFLFLLTLMQWLYKWPEKIEHLDELHSTESGRVKERGWEVHRVLGYMRCSHLHSGQISPLVQGLTPLDLRLVLFDPFSRASRFALLFFLLLSVSFLSQASSPTVSLSLCSVYLLKYDLFIQFMFTHATLMKLFTRLCIIMKSSCLLCILFV